MSVNSLLADMIATLKNGQMAKRRFVDVRKSKLNSKVLDVLVEQGYIDCFEEVEIGSFPKIRVFLRYYNRKPVITTIKLVSKPGCRCYIGFDDIKKHRVRSGLGIVIISTSSGIMTDYDAYHKKIGGELLCKVF